MMLRCCLVTSRVWLFCYTRDYSPPDSSVHGIVQTIILEWVAIFLFQGILLIQRRKLSLLLCKWILYHWATRKALRRHDQFSHSVMFDSLQPYGLHHTRLSCPSPTSRACSHSYPLSWWCHPTISSSFVPVSNSSALRMIQAHYIYCVLYFYYYYVSSTSDQQALDPGGWGLLLIE